MSRSKTSKAWLKEHFDDHYVKKAKESGYRSRASFKLLELQEKDHLMKKGMTVVDLGAAPGGWSQIAAELVGDTGRVVASDILPMDSLAGVEFVQGDFTEESVLNEILAVMDGKLADLVISDMAPNMSGMNSIDQPAAMYLVELALEMAKDVLKPKGNFVAKVFQGEGFDQYLMDVRAHFDRVVTRKPDSSRARSREVYIIGLGFK
ncbi:MULTISPECIES: 23S rRNA (uridine(2552)-2'-O)-methyltransferase RlmE [Neptunomonas]|uniref:Ribosomal RNA large subunit methyltransferase E n=1 Tax=Neptunomonas qingdaonensis TaxID=1045558 RepID=A0A1I2VXV2_9GAMM|nr:23S rRNA (uridine(2552)-2'-O)-methyltransferase RlmE [Neptunomonas qingdaonensis]SFG93157.1 23S rRNA (uridine2552-2'-O)-methyltransferase [Neptunomonas qingdaonensis]